MEEGRFLGVLVRYFDGFRDEIFWGKIKVFFRKGVCSFIYRMRSGVFRFFERVYRKCILLYENEVNKIVFSIFWTNIVGDYGEIEVRFYIYLVFKKNYLNSIKFFRIFILV